ncbi:MAG: hypothetical protein FWC68_05140, partial [Oscillospiraceae bacterium]|nr:hypothetical protein [Oscillospiraceae bacterium]
MIRRNLRLIETQNTEAEETENKELKILVKHATRASLKESKEDILKLDFPVKYVEDLREIKAKTISYYLDVESSCLVIFDNKTIYCIKLTISNITDILTKFCKLDCNKYGYNVYKDLDYMS